MGFPPVPPSAGGTPPPPSGGVPGGPPAGPPPGPTGPYVPPPGGGDDRSSSGRGKWFLLLAVVLIAALVGGYLVLSEDDANADEIFLEPVDFSGDDPFTDPVVTDGARALATAVKDQRDDDDGLVRGSVNGSEEGLYGGTLNESVCDREQLVDFLGDNRDKAEAFAGVLDIDVDDIPTYIASLTPVVLRGDTRVTNHGFADGRATSLQSVLEAGTAVLVDDQGVPRVKCYCGNPLTEPVEVSSPTYGGDDWDGWDPADVQVTFVDVDIDIFVITDVVDGGRFDRPTGTDGGDDTPNGGDEPPPETTLPPDTTLPPATTVPLGTGDVQVTLSWSTGEDLDLHVIDPAGDEISYSNPTSPSGGQLDHDDQAGCESGGGSHVENVFWPTGAAPPGQYQVFVQSYNGCGTGGNFTLEIKVDGAVVNSVSASVADDGVTENIPFTVS